MWKFAEGNVGDNLPLRRFRLRTTNHPFLLCTSSFPVPLSPPVVRFVLHLGAYRTESLCIPMTTGWMHSKCKRMRDNAQVNVSRERDFGERMRLFSLSDQHSFRNRARLAWKQNNLLAINNLGKQIGIIILDGIMPEDGEISTNCVLYDQSEQNNITLIVTVAAY